MSNTQTLYTQYQTLTQKAADLNYAAAVLGWDQETYMPPKGFPYRGRQLATLAAQSHELTTSEKYRAMLEELRQRADLTEEQQLNVRLSFEDYDKARRLPTDFVEELTQATSNSLNAWIRSRHEGDFSTFAPELDTVIRLKQRQAAYYGYEAHPYDALMDDYEKGATVAMVDGVFASVKAELPLLLQEIAAAPQVDDRFFNRHYPKKQQWEFSLEVLKAIGYDFEAGRQDYSEHPFTTSFAPTDVRITTRVNEEDMASLLWSTIHEGGHALYEQGLPEAFYGMPLGGYTSLSIHESQSRLWENCVGRSLPFWKYFYPRLQQVFPEQLNAVSPEDFYRGANKVQPSLIRTEADELTYHFHVLIRYEIEKLLITGNLETKDLPVFWNEQYQHYLGIIPPDDRQGVLQDVHWSHGSFGYFPTYSLGSFYAAQFFEQAGRDLPQLPQLVSEGRFTELLQWLRTHIHQHGRRYRSEELCRRITGRGLEFGAFMRYARDKYARIYKQE